MDDDGYDTPPPMGGVTRRTRDETAPQPMWTMDPDLRRTGQLRTATFTIAKLFQQMGYCWNLAGNDVELDLEPLKERLYLLQNWAGQDNLVTWIHMIASSIDGNYPLLPLHGDDPYQPFQHGYYRAAIRLTLDERLPDERLIPNYEVIAKMFHFLWNRKYNEDEMFVIMDILQSYVDYAEDFAGRLRRILPRAMKINIGTDDEPLIIPI